MPLPLVKSDARLAPQAGCRSRLAPAPRLGARRVVDAATGCGARLSEISLAASMQSITRLAQQRFRPRCPPAVRERSTPPTPPSSDAASRTDLRADMPL